MKTVVDTGHSERGRDFLPETDMNRTAIWLRRIALFVVLGAATASPASAQSGAGTDARVKAVLAPGMTVWITDTTGREERTRIVDVADNTVTTTAGDQIRRLRTTEIARIRVRHADSVLNGAVVGAGIAVASGLSVCRLTEPWENCRDDVGPMLRIGAVGAGIGVVIDTLIRRQHTIYERRQSLEVHALPVVTRQVKGLRFSVSF